MRRCVKARYIWKALNYPIYLPDENRDVAALMVKGDAPELVRVLKRRASLGSGCAAALLGFFELMGAFSAQPNSEAAIAYCTGPAKEGDPYAQYVLAWACWQTGKRRDALRWMTRSARDSKFLPAWVGLGSILLTLAENDAEVRDAVKILWRAHRSGHVAALPLICKAALRGHLGPIPRLLGTIALPYALVRLTVAMYYDPFGVRSFAYMPHPKVPLFR